MSMAMSKICLGLTVCVLALAETGLAQISQPVTPPLTTCQASPDWITSPNPPQEIPGGGTNFCQFYQFAWQWFLYLMSPAAQDKALRNFEVQANFPILQGSGTNSCTQTPTTRTLFVRTTKESNPFGKMVLPKDTGQAGGGATIFDQNGNVVYYEVRFSRNECSTPSGSNFPPGTTELKLAWRVLKPEEASRYYTITTTIEGVTTSPVLLGLVGFHLARNTAEHPEFVWATWEHQDNAPNCLSPQPVPQAGWSFASSQCAQCLKTSTTGPLGCAQCNFNVATPNPSVTGPPTQICRVYPDGSAPTDNKVAENIADVDALNLQLIGPTGILSNLPPSSPLSVLRNYFNVGGLWVSNPKEGATSANQRGSLQLASAVQETTFQGNFSLVDGKVQRSAAVNCFGCHQYTPPQPTTQTGLSHIFDDITGNISSPK